MPAERALLLDLDGTLVDSIPCWVEAYLDALAVFGRPMDRTTLIETIYQKNDPMPAVLERLGIDATQAEFRAVRDEHYVRLLEERVAWFPGAEALLAAADAPIGIVTTSWREYVEAIDRRLGLHARVDAVVDLDDVPAGRAKPDGYPLALAAERLGVEPSACVYVGDQAHDMSAARNAGMPGWLVPQPETPEAAHTLASAVHGDLDALAGAWRDRGPAPVS